MVVIIETHTEPINPPSASPVLTHAQFWDGVVYGLRNNHVLVPSIKATKVVSHTDEELVILQTLDDHPTLGHTQGEHKNRFTLSPPSKFDGVEDVTTDFHCIGIIAQGPGGEKDLYFTMSYEWNAKEIQRDSAEHEEKKKTNYHPRDYARAFIDNTRKLVKNGEFFIAKSLPAKPYEAEQHHLSSEKIMKGNRFFVLPYSLHEEHIPHLMGRVVIDPLDPLRRFAPDPDHHGFNPEDIVPTILRKPIPYRSRHDVIHAASNITLQGSLASYFAAHVGRDRDHSVELESDFVSRYQMNNNTLVFRTLMADQRYSAQVEQLLTEAKTDEALLVTGFLTTKTTRWTTSAGREHGAGVNVEVPVGELLGAPIDIDPAVDLSLSRKAAHDMSGQVDIEEIFAVAYDVVRHRRSPDRKARYWVATTTVLGDEKRTKAGHLAFGEEGSDEEFEYHPETGGDDTSALVLEHDGLPSAVKSSDKFGYLDFDRK